MTSIIRILLVISVKTNEGNSERGDRCPVLLASLLSRAHLHVLHLILSGDRVRRNDDSRLGSGRRQGRQLGHRCLLQSIDTCIDILHVWRVQEALVLSWHG